MRHLLRTKNQIEKYVNDSGRFWLWTLFITENIDHIILFLLIKGPFGTRRGSHFGPLHVKLHDVKYIN